MISETTGRKIDRTFDGLKPAVKNKLFQEIKDLGLKIEYGAESWRAYMERKARMTQGKLSKMYSLFAKFEKDDVDVFLDAFSEVDKPLAAKKKELVHVIGNFKQHIGATSGKALAEPVQIYESNFIRGEVK